MRMPAVASRPVVPIPLEYWTLTARRARRCRSCGQPVSRPHATGCPVPRRRPTGVRP
jgi:hypothetical protein